MTWAELIARGSGKVAYRVVVAGYRYEWVTADRLVGASSDGRQRVVGLQHEGLRVGARIIPAESRVEGQGCSFTIADIDAKATSEYARVGSPIARLSTDVDPTDTTLVVTNTSAFTIGSYYFLDGECVKVIAKPSSTELTVERAKRDTHAKYHYTDISSGNSGAESSFLTHPYTMRNARVKLYAYGDNETGDGTLVFTGIVSAPPRRESPVKWTFSASDLTSALDYEVGAVSLGSPGRIRGISWPWTHAFEFAVVANGSSNKLKMTGYWPTPEQLAATLETNLRATWAPVKALGNDIGDFSCYVENGKVVIDWVCGAAFAGCPTIMWCVPEGDLSKPGAETKMRMHVVGGDPSGLATTNTPWTMVKTPDGYIHQQPVSTDLGKTFRVDTSTIDYRLQSPWAWLGGQNDQLIQYGVDATAISFAPSNRLYLDSNYFDFKVGDRVELGNVGWKDAIPYAAQSPNVEGKSDSVTLRVSAVDTALGTIDVILGEKALGLSASQRPYGAGGPLTAETEVRKPVTYSDASPGVTATHTSLAGLIGSLIANGANSTSGDHADLRSGDFGSYSGDVLLAVDSVPYFALRTFVYSSPERVRAILEEECKLIGCYLALDTSGRIVVRRLVSPQDTEAVTTIHPLTFPGYSLEEDGLYTIVRISSGYEPSKKSWNGRSFEVSDSIGIGLGTRRVLEIKPRSNPSAAVLAKRDEAAVITSGRIFELFARAYASVTVKVPIVDFNVALGDVVLLTNRHVPDPATGINGVTARECLVVGREWDLHECVGTLTLYMFADRSRGYAPNAKVIMASSVNLGGNSYRIACTENYFAPAGRKDVSYFRAGDKITVLREELGWSGASAVGTITSVDSASTPNTITATFSSALPGGWPGASDPNTYVLAHMIDPGSSDITTNMASFAYVADADRVVPNQPGRLPDKMGG